MREAVKTRGRKDSTNQASEMGLEMVALFWGSN